MEWILSSIVGGMTGGAIMIAAFFVSYWAFRKLVGKMIGSAIIINLCIVNFLF